MRTTNLARLAACPIGDGGTPVDDWTGWGRQFAVLDIAACPCLVIVAPHPDDETLGMGATAALLRGAGIDVHVVCVSDGEAAHPGSDAEQRTQLARVRRAEIRCAAALLDIAPPIHLGLPDGELDCHEHGLVERLTALLAGLPPGTWCAATWQGDGHPDHEVVGRAAAVAAKDTGTAFFEYPVWMWHWATPGDLAVPWHRARRVPLSADAVNAKRCAIQCFTSQIEPNPNGAPVLPPVVLHRLLTIGEVVFV